MPPNTTIPSITTETQQFESVQLAAAPMGEVSPVASTSGVSTPSGISAPIFNTPGLISRTVTFDPFQPPDLITASVPITLNPDRTNELWNLAAAGESSLNYDSNITRSSSGAPLSDGYFHGGAGFDFRLGTKSEPFALDLSYDYTADIFNRYSQFDTYTNNFNFTARIGRSNFVLVPYVVGRFRSVESQDAIASGRQSYNFLMAGFHGENTYFPNLVHLYDFSHLSVNYPAQVGTNFEIWDLTQQLNYTVRDQSPHNIVDSFQLFPWFELRQTTSSASPPIDEVNGGVGASVTLTHNLTGKAQIGWGNVSSSSHVINYGSFSGFRYNASLDYEPWSYLILSADIRRVLSFNPLITSPDTDELDFTIASPFNFGPKLIVTPAVGIFRAVSNDSPSAQSSIYLQPAFTVSYKFNEHVAVYGKVEYSSDIDNQVGTTTYTNDLQGTVGFSLLF